jgi:hypothetical protein
MKKKIIIGVVLLIVVSIIILLVSSLDVFKPKATDLQIVKDFSTIQTKIIEFYQKSKRLPENLDELSDLPAKYEYLIQSETNFQLCAEFQADITEEVATTAPIRVDYKKGNSCVTFNIASAVQTDQTPTIVKKEAALVRQTKSITAEPSDGVSAGSINIKFDTAKSYFYKNDTDGNYFINFYTTIGTNKECKTMLNPEKGCCYSLNDVSLGSASSSTAEAIPAVFNRLGSGDYINPFPVGAENTFGDLPVNFCFQGNKEFSGGLSFSLPNGLIDLNGTSKLEFKHTNNGETSGALGLTIK